MDSEKNRPSQEIIKEAKRYPNGWVYQIDREYYFKKNVPPDAIAGAWKVDRNGNIVGDFIPNPNYNPKQKKSKHD